jgi:hypothetical protein
MVGGQRIHNLVPHSGPAPANEAIVAGGVRAKVLRQITPRRTRTQNPKDAVEHAPVIYTGHAVLKTKVTVAVSDGPKTEHSILSDGKSAIFCSVTISANGITERVAYSVGPDSTWTTQRGLITAARRTKQKEAPSRAIQPVQCTPSLLFPCCYRACPIISSNVSVRQVPPVGYAGIIFIVLDRVLDDFDKVAHRA